MANPYQNTLRENPKHSDPRPVTKPLTGTAVTVGVAAPPPPASEPSAEEVERPTVRKGIEILREVMTELSLASPIRGINPRSWDIWKSEIQRAIDVLEAARNSKLQSKPEGR